MLWIYTIFYNIIKIAIVTYQTDIFGYFREGRLIKFFYSSNHLEMISFQSKIEELKKSPKYHFKTSWRDLLTELIEEKAREQP